MYYVYAILNRQFDKIYIGQTSNLTQRIESHNAGTFKRSYTSRFVGKWDLIYSEQVSTYKDALKRERQLKSYRGREFIKKLIK